MTCAHLSFQDSSLRKGAERCIMWTPFCSLKKKGGRGKSQNRSVTMVTSRQGEHNCGMDKEVLLLTIHISCLNFDCVCMHNLQGKVYM